MVERVAIGVMRLIVEGSLSIVGLKNHDPRVPHPIREVPGKEGARKFYSRVAVKHCWVQHAEEWR